MFSGKQAKEIGLVDKLGNIQDAIKEAKQLGKLPEDAPVVEIAPPKSFFNEILKIKIRY